MNHESANTSNTLPVANGKKIPLLWLIIVLGVLLATAVGGVYLWQQMNRVIYRQQSDLTELQNRLAEMQKLLATEDEQLKTHAQQLATTDERLNVLHDATQKATELSSRAQRGWIIAEIDYLLRLANRRLEISRDINGAIAALKGADQRLHDLADVSLLPLRKQLAKDIGLLKAIPQTDVDGLALALDQMIAHLGELPFKAAVDEVKSQLPETPATDQTQKDKRFFDSVIDTIMTIGDIKIHQRGVHPATSSLQQYEIEERLLTHLAGARLAALRQNDVQFDRDIGQARQLLEKYYEPKDNRVAQMLADLKTYSNLDLLPALPDISASWRMLNGTQSGDK